MPSGALVLAAQAGDAFFGLGPSCGPAGVVGAGPDLLQLAADVAGCPGGLGGIGAAHVQQRSVGQAAQVDPVDRAERGERAVPGGAFLGAVPGWLGADGLGGMVVAVQLAVGAD